MGGGVIHDFFFAITLGVLIGTYSSLFVAAPTTMFFEKFQNRKA
jgi:preprotein translocase subunit SecF